MNSDIVVVLHKVSASPVLASVEGRKLSLTELEISFEEPKGGGGKLPSSGGSLYDDSSDSEYGPTEDEDDSDEESDCGDFDEEYIDWEDDDFDDPGGGGGGGGGSSPSNKFMLVNSLFHSSISYILNFEQDGDDDDEEEEKDNVPQEPVQDGSAKHFEEVDTRDNEKCVEEESSNAAVSVPESITKLDQQLQQDGINKDEAASSATEDCNAEDSFDLLFGGLFLDSLFRRSTSPEPPAEAAELSPEAELVDNAVENIISPPNAGLDLPLTMEEIKRNIEMLQLADEEGKLVAVAVTEANRKWNCVHVQSVQLVDIETSNLMRKKISFNMTEPKDVRIFERLPQELLTPEPPRWLRPSLEDDLKAEAMMAEYLEAEPEELIFDLEF